MRPLYIFDLDGTLALNKHREHFIKGGKPDWDAYFLSCGDDIPNISVMATLFALEQNCEIWIWSGRGAIAKDQTTHWLKTVAHISEPIIQSLRMRETGDFTPDHDLKKSWLLAMSPEDRKRLIAVFDDRDKVVKMWRENGVSCFQVAEGNF